MHNPKLTPAASKFALSLLSSLVLIGCTSYQPQSLKPVNIAPNDRQNSVTLVSEIRAEENLRPAATVTQSVRTAPLLRIKDNSSSQAKQLALPAADVTLNADQLPLNSFINLALGDVLGVNYIVDQELASRAQPVTLRVNNPVSSQRMLGLVEEVLQVNGVALALEDGVIKVIPANKTQDASPALLSGAVKPVLRYGNVAEIIPVYYLPLNQAMTLAERAVRDSKGSVLMQSNLNAMMVVARQDDIDRLHDLLAELDVPNRVASNMTVATPAYLTLEELIKDLKSALEASGVPVSTGSGNNGVVLVPMSNNTLLITASTREWLGYAQDWVRRLDKPKPASGGDGVYAYFMKNTQAADAWSVVSAIFGDGEVAGQGPQGQDLVAAAEQQAGQSSTGVRPENTGPGNRGFQSAGQGQAVSQSVITDEYRVVIDNKRNALIFTGRFNDYQRLVELLEFVDRRARQVLLQAVVAEIQLSNDSSLGTEWNITQGDITGGTTGLLQAGNLNLSGVFGDVTAKFAAALETGDAKVLSSPRIIALDQETASINIGQQIAVKTGEISSGNTNAEVVNSFKYVDVGITLEITPSINENGLVELAISQEVSSPGAGGGDTPPINTRSLQTRLLADSGDTVYMGGLISQNIANNESKVPLLGDIPGLGYLFKYQTQRESNTELVLLVTPYVINSREEANFYTEQFRTLTGWEPMPGA